MDPKEYLNTSVGMPTDPDKQGDPDAEGKLPGDGGRAALTDMSDQNAGQRTEAGLPWHGAPELQDGARDAYNAESDEKSGHAARAPASTRKKSRGGGAAGGR